MMYTEDRTELTLFFGLESSIIGDFEHAYQLMRVEQSLKSNPTWEKPANSFPDGSPLYEDYHL